MPRDKVVFEPLRFAVATNNSVVLDLKLAEAERVVSAVAPKRGNIRGAIRGTTISLRLQQSAHRFLSGETTRSVVFYCDERDLAALAWAVEDAKAAAAQFGSKPC